MRSYKQIRADIAKLEREAEAAKKTESAAIVARIKAMAREYSLTAADLGLDVPSQARGAGEVPSKPAARKAASKKSASKTSSRSGAGIAKYRDPKSGKTWTGFGRAPDWLASAKNRGAFLIDGSSAQAATTAPESDARARQGEGRRIASKAAKTGAAKAPAKKAGRKSAAPARPTATKLPAVKGVVAKKSTAAGKNARKPARKATPAAREQTSAAGNEAAIGEAAAGNQAS